MLLAVPKYGRVKTNRILNQCRISPSKTIGGLSERQRAELVSQLAPVVDRADRPRPVSIRGRMAKGLRDHRPHRGRQGDADLGAARARPRPRALGLGDDPRSPARARSTGATTTSSPRRSSTGGSRPRTSSSSPPTAATATGRCAPRCDERLAAGRSVVLEIEVQGARQVRAAMRESVQVFIAPPEPGGAARAPARRGAPTPPRRSTPASRSPSRSWPPRTSSPTASSTTISSRAADELEGIVRAELGLPLHSGAE